MTRRDERRAKGAEKHRYSEVRLLTRIALERPSEPTEPGDYWTGHGWRDGWGHAAEALLLWLLT